MVGTGGNCRGGFQGGWKGEGGDERKSQERVDRAEVGGPIQTGTLEKYSLRRTFNNYREPPRN